MSKYCKKVLTRKVVSNPILHEGVLLSARNSLYACLLILMIFQYQISQGHYLQPLGIVLYCWFFYQGSARQQIEGLMVYSYCMRGTEIVAGSFARSTCITFGKYFSTIMVTVLERVAFCFFLGKKVYLNIVRINSSVVAVVSKG